MKLCLRSRKFLWQKRVDFKIDKWDDYIYGNINAL